MRAALVPPPSEADSPPLGGVAGGGAGGSALGPGAGWVGTVGAGDASGESCCSGTKVYDSAPGAPRPGVGSKATQPAPLM